MFFSTANSLVVTFGYTTESKLKYPTCPFDCPYLIIWVNNDIKSCSVFSDKQFFSSINSFTRSLVRYIAFTSLKYVIICFSI